MKDNRLSIIRSSSEIEHILKTGRFIKGKTFKFFYKKGTGRYAALASKKIFPTAVARNLTKRQIRMIAREFEVKNVDIIISAMQSWKDASYEDNKNTLIDSYKTI